VTWLVWKLLKINIPGFRLKIYYWITLICSYTQTPVFRNNILFPFHKLHTHQQASMFHPVLYVNTRHSFKRHFNTNAYRRRIAVSSICLQTRQRLVDWELKQDKKYINNTRMNERWNNGTYTLHIKQKKSFRSLQNYNKLLAQNPVKCVRCLSQLWRLARAVKTSLV
jgi:hypothetical protein